MGQALQAGKVVNITPKSLAKTLGAPYVAEDALRLAQKHLHRYIMVKDREAFEEEVFLLERAKNQHRAGSIVQTWQLPGRRGGHSASNDQVVLLICGGNNSLENLVNTAPSFLSPWKINSGA